LTVCHGLGERHCCWFGVPCPHVEEDTVEGRRWACGLLRRLGSWAAVHASTEWQQTVKPLADAAGLPATYTCGDWPQYEIRAGRAPSPDWACCWGTP
jgi:hypothetical protein